MTTLPSHRFDVIVVGAGPAGVTAAMALGKAGFSVLVCEAGIYPGAENWSGAVYFTENLEHPDAFGKEGVESAPYERRLVERGAFLYNGHSLVGASLKSPDVFRSCYTVLRPVYDRYLAEVARDTGVVLSCETTVQSLIRHDGRVIGVHTERGPAYADVVFLAEGDASHLVTQEGYERVSAEEQAEGAPHFLQGVKEVISLDPGVIEERFGLAPGEGAAMEMLLRNATRKGRTIRLNMGGFLYTNRDSISLGFVLPLDNLKHHFEGNHNILMEWYKQLPEVARLLGGGELTSYGAKIIRGGGLREIPRMVADGLAIGGAASGIGVDFPYPNFTGPATSMGLQFAQAVIAIAGENGGPGGVANPADSPYTEAALRKSYLSAVEASHYYRSVDYLRDWPAYIERTQFFFDRQLDLANNAAVAVSRPGRGPLGRWWDFTKVVRRAVPAAALGEVMRDTRELGATIGLTGLIGAALTPANLVRVLWNTVGALIPFSSDARIGASEPDASIETSGVAEATSHDGARLRAVFRVAAGTEEPGRPPLLFRWFWRRYGGALASAFSEVYTNDDAAIGDKLRAAARHVGGRASIWDLIAKLGLGAILGVTWALQALFDRPGAQIDEDSVDGTLAANRERIRLDDSRVNMSVPYETKLGTITYQEGHTSHIKVMWPDDLGARHDITSSELWNICPAKVYEVRRNRMGHPGIVVNFDNCIKCETCWRATDDVHWSRATQQRLIYQVYTPAQAELHAFIESRSEPTPRLGKGSTVPGGLVDGTSAISATDETLSAARLFRTHLARARVAFEAFAADLHRAPMALDAGRRANLGALGASAAEACAEARAVWDSTAMGEVRATCGPDAAAVWEDATARLAEYGGHIERRRFFWAELLGRQLLDHHFATLQRACDRAVPADDIAPDTLTLWSDALAWRAQEAGFEGEAETRLAIQESATGVFDTHGLRAIDRGAELEPEQKAWLWHQVQSVAGADRRRREILVEELAGIDPALAYVAGSHLLALDVLTQAGQVVPTGWLTLVHGGLRAVTNGEVTADVDFVPAAAAEHAVVVAGSEAAVVPLRAVGVSLEDVGTVGLIWAQIRRLRVNGYRSAAFDVTSQLDSVAIESPAAGEPWAALLGPSSNFLAALVRGAGNYLLDRARDHASGRVQFPGSFEDEAGRDTIAKFGAVKQMLAEMEAHRYVLETASMTPLAGDDEWAHSASLKILASDAFGPGERSFGYLTGQLFGGTAFSEDDVIAKFYRDSAPARFLFGHDDAIRVALGQHRLAADRLVPTSADEQEWLDRAGAGGALAAPTARLLQAIHIFEAWGREAQGTNDELLLHVAGTMVVRALAVKVVLVRAARRIEAGLPTVALSEAARLLADRLLADAPALAEEAELARHTLAAGEDLIAHGDPFVPPAVADAADYETLCAEERDHRSGEWLTDGFDVTHARYVPEILGSDPHLADAWRELEAEFRERYVEKEFDGHPYGRWLEHLHLIPQEDLDYMVRRGFMRMVIDGELGGEGLKKARYYVLCMLIGRYGDAALSLAIMANTSIGTTPTTIGLYQDLPRARAELERVRENPAVLGEIRDGIDRVLTMVPQGDLEAITTAYKEVGGLVRGRVAKSMVLRYIGGGFLRAFNGAGRSAKQRDLIGFEKGLRGARELIDGILAGVNERLEEYPRREAAHHFFLKTISAGYISAFALTEPTAGSDSGGVKTTARAETRRVRRDEDGVLWFWLDEDAQSERRYVLDADRVEFDYDGSRLLYRYADDAPATPIDHSEYDYDKDSPERMRSYMHGDRRVYFTDIAQLRLGEDGEPRYQFWVLNGAKMWITNGRFSHCMALYARTEPEGVTGFMVDRHAEGLVIGADEEKLGQRGSPTNEISLNNVRVPRENILGFRGRGQVNALETLNTGRAGLCVTTHSAIQEMVEDAHIYLNGEPLRHFPYRQRSAARPLERYWTGRLAEELLGTAGTTYEIIGLLDNKHTDSVRMESAVGKYYGSEAQHDCVDWMERVRGLEGQTWLHRVEKTRRDARVLNIYEGTNEVQRFLVLKDLVQRVLPAVRKTPPAAPSAELAHADLAAELYAAQTALMKHVGDAVDRFGQLVWANVGAQPCFLRLAEIAGMTKVIDSVLYRLEWCARHETPGEHRDRIEAIGRHYIRRALSRIGVLERRYELAYAYQLEGRYSPETLLGVLSLEDNGAVVEAQGVVPAAAKTPATAEPLSRPVRIAVLLRPVPMDAPRPRLDGGRFTEPLRIANPDDAAALELALQLRARDTTNVEVVAYGLGGDDVRPLLRDALARGASSAFHIDVGANTSLPYDTRLAADVWAATMQEQAPDLVLCGEVATDTGQVGIGSFVAAVSDRELVIGIDGASWSPEGELAARSDNWGGTEIEVALPAVLSVVAGQGTEADAQLADVLGAAAAEIPRIAAADHVAGVLALDIAHAARVTASAGDETGAVDSPEDAAGLVAAMAGESAAGAGNEAPAYEGRMMSLGEQPPTDEPSCVFIAAPVTNETAGTVACGELEAAARLAAASELPLDVVVPVDGDAAAAALAVGAVLNAATPRRIIAITAAGLKDFGTSGHLEWLEEFWAMYRAAPRWLFGTEWANDLFARFAPRVAATAEAGRCWNWHNVELLSNGDGFHAATQILGGAARADAKLPVGDGLRLITLASNVEAQLRDCEVSAGEPEVYGWVPQLGYALGNDPVAAVLAALGQDQDGLENAEFLIDLGYGAGGRDGIDELVEPLRKLLADELGLERVMVGATRKVTQDLELLPMDRQIGQTGVSVNPRLIVALAVSGAPQHVDYIGERATILSFNIDPDAPLMRLNDQRARPIVHPIVGDIWETVPRFIEELRRRASSDSSTDEN